MTAAVLSGQSMLDIAVQTAGDAAAAIAMAVANDRPVTDTLTAGEAVRTAAVANRDTAEYYKNKNLRPATSFTGIIESAGIFDDSFDNTFE